MNGYDTAQQHPQPQHRWLGCDWPVMAAALLRCDREQDRGEQTEEEAGDSRQRKNRVEGEIKASRGSGELSGF